MTAPTKKILPGINQIIAYSNTDLSDENLMTVSKFELTPGEYVAALLPSEGLNTVTWTDSGAFDVYWDSNTQILSWGIQEKYKPENNEVSDLVNVVCQDAGTYTCIAPYNRENKAVIGDVHLSEVGDSRTAMPGQWLVICSGAFIKDSQIIDKPTFIYADTESVSISCVEKGNCSKVELIPVAEIAERYNDPI